MPALVEDGGLCTGELHLLEDGFIFAGEVSLPPFLEEGLPFVGEVCMPPFLEEGLPFVGVQERWQTDFACEANILQ